MDFQGVLSRLQAEAALGELMLRDEDYVVQKMRWANRDERSAIIYNSRITLSGIPPEALRYVVSGKSAIDWVIERYGTLVDSKSGIINDANDWIFDQIQAGDGPNALIHLIQRVIHLSVETMKIVDDLPPSFTQKTEKNE